MKAVDGDRGGPAVVGDGRGPAVDGDGAETAVDGPCRPAIEGPTAGLSATATDANI